MQDRGVFAAVTRAASGRRLGIALLPVSDARQDRVGGRLVDRVVCFLPGAQERRLTAAQTGAVCSLR